jgi:phosphate transport system permease protein
MGRIGSQAPRAKLREAGFRYVLLACMGASVLLLAMLLVDVAADGKGQLSLDFITSYPSVVAENAGVRAALLGTIWLMIVVALFIIPVGVATALYLEEYADHERWYNRLIEVNIQNLAAVPSIVYGILGLAFLVRGPFGQGNVVLAGGLTLGLLVLPVVIIAGREAIRAVPPSIREGSLALGATQWQTIRRQVLPASIPGIATGVILAVSRALGEAAPLLLVGAATFVTADQPNPFEGGYSAMPVQIFNYALQPQDEFRTLAAAGVVVMLVVLLAMNSFAIWLRNRYEQQW